jgi:hypothetical protein
VPLTFQVREILSCQLRRLVAFGTWPARLQRRAVIRPGCVLLGVAPNAPLAAVLYLRPSTAHGDLIRVTPLQLELLPRVSWVTVTVSVIAGVLACTYVLMGVKLRIASITTRLCVEASASALAGDENSGL